MSASKFIRPMGKSPQAAPPAPQRRIVEEIATQTFEFPSNKGVRSPESAVMVPQSQAPTIAPVAAADKTFAERNPAYVTIDLPSTFQFYDFKTLSVRTLLASHQAKFSRAAKEQKMRYSVEALSATLEPDRSAFELSVPDFYFLLFWQRVNSFSKTPMLITAYCDNEKHNHDVHIGETKPDPTPEDPDRVMVIKKHEDTLRIEQVLQNTTLDTKYADPVDVTDLEITRKYQLDVERMKDVVETIEYLTEGQETTEEQLFLLGYAGFLKSAEGQANIKEKLQAVADMTPDDISEFDEYIKRVSDYGVAEYANVKCKECGASVRVKISLDALTFLPGSRRAEHP
jgi:hypothetical protein